MMPKLDGIDGLPPAEERRRRPSFTPIILVTAMTEAKDIVAGLEAGADEYLTKPVDHAALSARVRSMLRIKALHDTVTAQAEEIARWNATLERRVAEQVAAARADEPAQAVLLAAASPTRSWPAAPPTRSARTGGRSAWSFSICAASRRSRRSPSPKRSRRFSGPTTHEVGRDHPRRTRARSSDSPATA